MPAVINLRSYPDTAEFKVKASYVAPLAGKTFTQDYKLRCADHNAVLALMKAHYDMLGVSQYVIHSTDPITGHSI